MSLKEELHDLVDELRDDNASEALAYLRGLVRGELVNDESALSRLKTRMGPPKLSGKEFFSRTGKPDLAALAEQQGARPITGPDDLKADFWPEDESIDEFTDTIRRWRREGGYA